MKPSTDNGSDQPKPEEEPTTITVHGFGEDVDLRIEVRYFDDRELIERAREKISAAIEELREEVE